MGDLYRSGYPETNYVALAGLELSVPGTGISSRYYHARLMIAE